MSYTCGQKNCVGAVMREGKWYLSKETPLSASLNLVVGQEIDDEVLPEGTYYCLATDAMSGEEVRAYREKRGMTIEGFAKAYGLKVKEVERFEKEGFPAHI